MRERPTTAEHGQLDLKNPGASRRVSNQDPPAGRVGSGSRRLMSRRSITTHRVLIPTFHSSLPHQVLESFRWSIVLGDKAKIPRDALNVIRQDQTLSTSRRDGRPKARVSLKATMTRPSPQLSARVLTLSGEDTFPS